MIEAFLVAKLGARAGRIIAGLLPYLLGALVVLGFVLWIRGMQNKIADQREQIGTLTQGLAVEKEARQRDVAALTSLSAGLTKAATDTKRDAQVLQETIDASHPSPSSPALAAFLAGLRQADSGQQPAGTSARARR